MEKQNNIAATPDTARVSPAPVSPPVQVSFRTDQFPAWMNRHQTWIVSVVSVMTLVALLGMGWAAYRVQHGLIQSSGHSLVQAATDAASRLDMMILERYSDIQLLATTPMAQGQNPEALTKYLHELVQAHPAYRWIGVTDSRGRIIATTDTPTSRDRSQSHWFQLARTITGVKILDAQVSEESRGATAITVIAPLRSPDGRFLGAITAVVGIPSLMHILDDTMLVLKNIEWTEESHIEYQLLNEKGDLIADSTMQQDGNFNLKQLGLPSAVLVGSNARGFVEETHHRRKTSVITAYAQVTIAHADPTLRWSVLISVDRDSILAPIRLFLQKLSFLAVLILLPLLGLALGMIKALHGEWGTAKREFQRAIDAEASLKQRTEALHTLVVAAQTLSAQKDLDGLLYQLLQLAKENSGARYAALVVYNNMTAATQFLTAGIDDAAAHAIRALPLEQRARESLGQEQGALRLAHLTKHWASLGFPADHAPLTSFLGVSIQCQGQFFGHLSLANKVIPQGIEEDFSELDEHRSRRLLDLAGSVGQVFVTATDDRAFAPGFRWDAGHRRFLVRRGIVTDHAKTRVFVN